MTETQHPYDIASWPMDNLIDLQMGPYDELEPFIASDFPSTAEIGLDYSWTAEQLNWANEYATKSNASQFYPPSWYEAGLVRQDYEWMNEISSLPNQSNQPTSFQTTENTPSARADLKLATQRALFMTPSPNPLAFPFPGSPVSDPRASPGSSRASSSGCEGEAEREDAQYSNFDFGASTFDTPYQSSIHNYQIDSPYHGYCKTEDDDCFTPLEMPDGTTRLTSNWLPVDQDAGLTIDCPTVLEDDTTAFHSSIMLDDDTAAFHSMKHAFFPADPTAWSYDR